MNNEQKVAIINLLIMAGAVLLLMALVKVGMVWFG